MLNATRNPLAMLPTLYESSAPPYESASRVEAILEELGSKVFGIKVRLLVNRIGIVLDIIFMVITLRRFAYIIG
jgi:hypothetical protein